MTLTILTPTGSALFKNTHTKAGYKALHRYIKYTQAERKPFVVLPAGTCVTDLHAITSAEAISY